MYLEKVSDGKRIRFLSLIRGSSSVAVKHIKLKARKHNRRKRLNFIFRLDVYASSHDTGYHTAATELGSNYSHNYSTIVSDLIRPDTITGRALHLEAICHTQQGARLNKNDRFVDFFVE